MRVRGEPDAMIGDEELRSGPQNPAISLLRALGASYTTSPSQFECSCDRAKSIRMNREKRLFLRRSHVGIENFTIFEWLPFSFLYFLDAQFQVMLLNKNYTLHTIHFYFFQKK
jgi:hypothetical protein